MSEKDTIIRQRLIELERKHAEALRKLQRAERSKQRRQTFHGFTVQDENAASRESQNTSSILLSQETFTPNVRKSSCLSTHKKGLCKTVTFKETVETDQQPLSEKSSNNGVRKTSSKGTSVRGSPPVGSCVSMNETEMLKVDVLGDNKLVDAADESMVKLTLPSDSLVLSDNGGVVVLEKQDCFQVQQCEDHNVNIGFVEDVPNMSECRQRNGDLSPKAYAASNENRSTTEKVESPSNETVSENTKKLGHNSQESLGLSKDSVSLNEKDGHQKGETSTLSSVSENNNSCSENWHWLHLFEEEFPRRSPRLRTTPNFGSQTVVSQENNVVTQCQARKTKPARTKQSRERKANTLGSKHKRKTNIEDTALCDSLSTERTGDDFVFPRPSLEHTKPGGPLGVVVDFSLPDKEFVKLKLAKIKSALSTERTNQEVNNIGEKKTEQGVNQMGKGSRLTKKVTKVKAEKTKEECVSEMERESKYGQEMKEDCSLTLTSSSSSYQPLLVQFDTEIKAKEAETTLAVNTSEKNLAANEKEPSSDLSQEGSRQTECDRSNSTFDLEFQQLDLQLHDMVTKSGKVSISSEQHKDAGNQTFTVGQIDSSHGNNSKSELVCGAALVCDDLQTDGVKKENGISPDVYERYQSQSECSKVDNQGGFENSEGLLDRMFPLKNSTAGIDKETKFPNQRESRCTCNDETSRTDVMHETSCSSVSFDPAVKGISRSPEKLNNERELFNLMQEKSSPPNPEPSLGDQATPHGKMKEPLESSQVTCVLSPEDHSKLSSVLMMACLQHHIDGEDNKVRSVALSSYELQSAERDVSLLQKKRDVLAVCLAHLVVIWTVVPGLQWTVLHKWSLPLDGEEEFLSVQFVPVKSHVVLLVGGNFYKGNGRILGYSEEGDYSLDLHSNYERNNDFFSTICLLQDTLEHKAEEDVEFIIGARTSHEVTLTKWSLDSFCLLVEGSQTFASICSDSELSSLQPVHESHCLVLGTTDSNLFLWNHKTCQLLRTISLHDKGLGGLSCLQAFTERGLLFLMMASNLAEEPNCGDTNTAACSLYALNPRTSKMIRLECFSLPERVRIVGTNGQYIAAGCQGRGEVNMWNLTNSQRHVTLRVFQDELSSIAFHQGKPLIAFGSAGGCVHLFSLY